MVSKENQEIFERYNPKDDVVRCPYGKSPLREELDKYALAATNLYGVIKREEFLEIFNQQNGSDVTDEELYILLLPLIIKHENYCFYEAYLVHYIYIGYFEYVENLLSWQEGKPRYIPEKREFLKYENEEYRAFGWEKVYVSLSEACGYSLKTLEFFEELRDAFLYGDGPSALTGLIEEHDISFLDQELAQEFLNQLMETANNTPIWMNNGYSPSQFVEVVTTKDKRAWFKRQGKKVGRNDLCPCGSGKKYKRCCALTENEEVDLDDYWGPEQYHEARLQPEEAREFYEIFYGLLAYVNAKKKVVREKIIRQYPNRVSDFSLSKVRDVLWEDPSIIDSYIAEVELASEEVEILKLWQKDHLAGRFTVIAHQPEYSLLLKGGGDDDCAYEGKVYGVKGMLNSLARIVEKETPYFIESVLLPFKGQIIYDGYLFVLDIDLVGSIPGDILKLQQDFPKEEIITSFD